MKIPVVGIATAHLLLAASAPLTRAAVSTGPGLQQTAEVISVLKSNYVDRDQLNDKVLDSATVAGILRALGQGAVIVPAEPAATNAPTAAAAELKSSEPLARARTSRIARCASINGVGCRCGECR